MTEEDAEVTAILLAKGLGEIFDQTANDGAPVQQDASLPPAARRALSMLSGLCFDRGVEDYGCSIHLVMDLASRPLSAWGIPQFGPPFRYADVVLADRDLGMPTVDCLEMAAGGSSEVAAREQLQHEQLRNAVQVYSGNERSLAYGAIREFVVRNPAVSDAALFDFLGEHVAVSRAISSFYRAIPQAALFGSVARRCAHCGSLLWPDRDPAFPDGRCRVRQCGLAHPTPAVRDEIVPAAWRLATNAILHFWVGPGLDEIRIHDALRAAGREAVLYPVADAADVGIDGLAVGIDVKTYASPLVLGAKLTKSIGRLDLFRRRVIAFPDDKLVLNPHYKAQLQDAYRGAVTLEFMTVSEAIRELAG